MVSISPPSAWSRGESDRVFYNWPLIVHKNWIIVMFELLPIIKTAVRPHLIKLVSREALGPRFFTQMGFLFTVEGEATKFKATKTVSFLSFFFFDNTRLVNA